MKIINKRLIQRHVESFGICRLAKLKLKHLPPPLQTVLQTTLYISLPTCLASYSHLPESEQSHFNIHLFFFFTHSLLICSHNVRAMMSRSQLVTRIQRELCTASSGQLIGFPGRFNQSVTDEQNNGERSAKQITRRAKPEHTTET